MALLSYFLAFLAAVSNAAANVLQRAANRDEDENEQFSLQLIRRLFHKPIWFAGIGAITASFFLQATALGVGTLAAVEPLIVLELPLTFIISARFLGARLTRRGWLAIGGMTAGTIALIAVLSPSGGSGNNVAWWIWLVAVSATVVVVGVIYWLAHHWEDQARRAALLGVGTGASYGLAAALTKGMTTQFADGGVLGVVTTWQLYGAIAAGVFAIWMHQNALGAGKLAVAQPGVTLTDPYLSIVWGAAVFGESMRSGIWVLFAVIAGLVMSASVFELARSTETSGTRAQRDDSARPAAKR